MNHYFRPFFSVTVAFVLACSSALALAASPRPFTAHSLADIRAHHAGKPLVVHIWAMSCGPCIGELPKWGEFTRTHRGVDLVLVRFDQAPSDATASRLAQAGLGAIESWGVVSEPDEYLRASVDVKWFGDVPRTLLIAPDGAVTSIRGVADPQKVTAWLDSVEAASRHNAR
ncbi:TlpA family protein disulfide reductase [Paraburkholderia dinghuensis]|uniref:TlpA family protein disulfide reductase n=1 Tax=Paraburkholderia dinghuensis TaxID=2305225 RepID=A0A3N6MYN7_9BURK|nr:TlpA family protein disulfide reductase [Paraburkholderia dinghuensis]RQH09114.1 TlpA family protein disulfide reductase [Paraburkholderia dinghuensis]